jgi:hypothetical protein
MKPIRVFAAIYLLLPLISFAQETRETDAFSAELKESYRIIAEEQKKIGALIRARLEADSQGMVGALSKELAQSEALPRSSVEDQFKAAISLALRRDLVSVDELHPDTRRLFIELMHPEVTANDSLAEAIFDRLGLPSKPSDIFDFAKQSERRMAWLSTRTYYERIAVYEYLSKQQEAITKK